MSFGRNIPSLDHLLFLGHLGHHPRISWSFLCPTHQASSIFQGFDLALPSRIYFPPIFKQVFLFALRHQLCLGFFGSVFCGSLTDSSLLTHGYSSARLFHFLPSVVCFRWLSQAAVDWAIYREKVYLALDSGGRVQDWEAGSGKGLMLF